MSAREAASRWMCALPRDQFDHLLVLIREEQAKTAALQARVTALATRHGIADVALRMMVDQYKPLDGSDEDLKELLRGYL